MGFWWRVVHFCSSDGSKVKGLPIRALHMTSVSDICPILYFLISACIGQIEKQNVFKYWWNVPPEPPISPIALWSTIQALFKHYLSAIQVLFKKYLSTIKVLFKQSILPRILVLTLQCQPGPILSAIVSFAKSFKFYKLEIYLINMNVCKWKENVLLQGAFT